jgi:UDP-N-acetylmuramoylalanine--D-glutamate ligase
MALKVVMLGGGESGVGAALLAKAKGYEVFVSDKGALGNQHSQTLNDAGIEWEEGQHDMEKLLAADLIIKSPGIPDKAPAVKALQDAGKPIISEIEFASWFCTGRTVGITGSNGKTTTTYLTHHLMASGGLNVAMGGNVGTSFARLLTQPAHAWYVLELSSFQLDGIRQYRPDIAMLITVTPDHLDRYNYEMELYTASKFRIAENQKTTDFFVFNQDSEAIKTGMTRYPIAGQLKPASSLDRNGQMLRVLGHNFDMTNCVLKGPHNDLNASCAIQTALLAGCDAVDIQRGLDSFKAVPHRLEPVATLVGVSWINDSKATNVDSVFWALKSMSQPTVLIIGGTDKGNDYSVLDELVAQKVKAIVAMGVDNSKIIKHFESKVPDLVSTHSLADALAAAQGLATNGDAVLLSPACASFDLFRNYEDRGDQFRAAVLATK